MCYEIKLVRTGGHIFLVDTTQLEHGIVGTESYGPGTKSYGPGTATVTTKGRPVDESRDEPYSYWRTVKILAGILTAVLGIDVVSVESIRRLIRRQRHSVSRFRCIINEQNESLDTTRTQLIGSLQLQLQKASCFISLQFSTILEYAPIHDKMLQYRQLTHIVIAEAIDCWATGNQLPPFPDPLPPPEVAHSSASNEEGSI